MPLKGDIKTFPLSAVGRMIHSEKKTGVLKVTSGGYSTSIYFKRGGIVFIDGELSKNLSLGSLLKTVNVIGEDDIQNSLEIARSMGKRLGVVLIDQGYITQEKLIKDFDTGKRQLQTSGQLNKIEEKNTINAGKK